MEINFNYKPRDESVQHFEYVLLISYYASAQANKLQDLLKTENVRFEDVMDEESLIQEFKEAKPHIIN